MRGSSPSLRAALGCCIALLARNRVEGDSEYSRARERLARDFDAFGGKLELAYENAGYTAPGTRETRHVPPRHRVEIDGEQHDRLAFRGQQRGTQRPLVADRQEHVNLARRELAIVSFVAFDIRRLDVVECEVPAFLITQFGQSLEKIGIDRRLPGLNPD